MIFSQHYNRGSSPTDSSSICIGNGLNVSDLNDLVAQKTTQLFGIQLKILLTWGDEHQFHPVKDMLPKEVPNRRSDRGIRIGRDENNG